MKSLGTPMLVMIVLVTGCVRVEFMEYRGRQDWPTGSAFVRQVEGNEDIDLYEGLPSEPYKVIGLVDVYDSDPLGTGSRGKVVELVRFHNADALLWLSARAVSSGFLLMGETDHPSAIIDAGRSTQPTATISSKDQTASAKVDSFRSTLLLIRFKGTAPG